MSKESKFYVLEIRVFGERTYSDLIYEHTSEGYVLVHLDRHDFDGEYEWLNGDCSLAHSLCNPCQVISNFFEGKRYVQLIESGGGLPLPECGCCGDTITDGNFRLYSNITKERFPTHLQCFDCAGGHDNMTCEVCGKESNTLFECDDFDYNCYGCTEEILSDKVSSAIRTLEDFSKYKKEGDS